MTAETPVFAAPVSWTADLNPVVDAAVRGLLGDRGNRLVVNLASTTFVASAGLTTLIRLGKRLAEAGGALALAKPSPAVAKLLRAVGLTSVLPAFAGLDEAIAFVAAPRASGARR